jgi:glucose-1-phosphate cytidylyltransferase
MAYKHNGFWKCMDTYKDNVELNQLWESHAPWKVW